MKGNRLFKMLLMTSMSFSMTTACGPRSSIIMPTWQLPGAPKVIRRHNSRAELVEFLVLGWKAIRQGHLPGWKMVL